MPLFALFSWPIVVFVLFSKYRVPVAILASMLGGYLLLPERISVDLPLLPKFTKHTIPALAVMAALWMTSPKNDGTTRPHAGFMTHSSFTNTLIVLFLVSPFLTVFTNSDALRYGPATLPGMRPYDAFSFTLEAMMLLLPFAFGYRYFGQASHHRLLLFVLMVAALLYALPTLFEVRMSPQLNVWIYGYFQHSFAQHVRGDGFRPIVFLEHGLWVSLFLAMGLLATLGMIKASPAKSRQKVIAAAAFLFVVLVMTKSLGVLIVSCIIIPAILFLNVRAQLIVAAIVAGSVLVYPMLRSSGLVPVDRITTIANSIDPARAESFSIRIRNEESLLAKAQERPLFGWGGYGRSRVFDARGNNVSVTDGYWVIVLGVGGWLGYIARFGLLTLPIILLALRSRQLQIGSETSALCLVMACNLIDLIPNAGITPITWILSGALWGRLAFASADDQTSAQSAHSTSTRQALLSRGKNPEQALERERLSSDLRNSPYTRQKNQKYRRT